MLHILLLSIGVAPSIPSHMPWVAALLVGLLTVGANIIINKSLRKITVANVEKQIRASTESAEKQLLNAKEIALAQIQNSKEISMLQFKATIATKNRQEWINDVRDSISDLLASGIAYATMIQEVQSPSAKDLTDQVYKIMYFVSKVKMLLNASKPEQAIIMEHLDGILTIVVNKKEFDFENYQELHTQLINDAQKLFNIHWRKIKEFK